MRLEEFKHVIEVVFDPWNPSHIFSTSGVNVFFILEDFRVLSYSITPIAIAIRVTVQSLIVNE